MKKNSCVFCHSSPKGFAGHSRSQIDVGVFHAKCFVEQVKKTDRVADITPLELDQLISVASLYGCWNNASEKLPPIYKPVVIWDDENKEMAIGFCTEKNKFNEYKWNAFDRQSSQGYVGHGKPPTVHYWLEVPPIPGYVYCGSCEVELVKEYTDCVRRSSSGAKTDDSWCQTCLQEYMP